MLCLSPEHTRRILDDPGFQHLVRARSRLRWGLSAVTLAMFFGFIILISASPSALGVSVFGGGIPIGLILAFAMIVAVVALTGFYVRRSNTHFDALSQSIRQELGQ